MGEGRAYREDSNGGPWQEWREQKHVGRTSQSLKELRPYPKSEADTWGQTGGGQEGIPFHSVGRGTQRHTGKGVLELPVLDATQPTVGSLTQFQVSPDSR